MLRFVVVGSEDAFTERLVATLGALDGVERAVAVTGPPSQLGRHLEEGTTAVYAAATRGPDGVRPDPSDAATAMDSLLRFPVRRLIVLSSAAIQEPNCHHPGHVDESRTISHRNDNSLPRCWEALEETATAAAQKSDTPVIVLRPAIVPLPAGRDIFSRWLTGRWATPPPGFDPSVQLLSMQDLAVAVIRAAEDGAEAGVYHVAPAGVIPLRKALRLAGTRRLPLPLWLQALWRRPLAPRVAAVDELEYTRFPFTVSGRKIERQTGFRPARSSARVVLELTGPSGHAPKTKDPSELVFDDYGFDRDYIDAYGRTLFKFLHDVYWRIEVRGLEHLPEEGGAVLTGVHRGHQPWDAVMLLHHLARETGRYPRFLIHSTLVKHPFRAKYLTKLGGLLACQENADWVLERGELLGIFPEGIRGAFALYRDVYKLGKFGRDEYVKIALRHQVPIVPFVTVGSAEIFPIYGKIHWNWWKRVSEWPFLPITPTMSLVPLPSKWHTLFLEPIHVAETHPPEAARDRATVSEISRRIRRRMQEAIDDLRARRKAIFWGSIFEEEQPA